MKILTRYILIQLLGPFLLGIGIFSLIFILAFIFELANGIIVKGIQPRIALLALLLYLPTSLIYALPIAALMANLVTWGEFKDRGEITAVRASGISLAPIIILVVILALFLSLILFLSNELFFSSNYRELWARGIEESQGIPLEEKSFIKVDRFEFFIERLNEKKRCMEGIYIYDSGEEDSPSYIIFARFGEYELTSSPGLILLNLLLRDGVIHHLNKDDPLRYHILRFKTKRMSISNLIESKERGIEELTLSELREKIEIFKESHLDHTLLALELHKREALPFALLAFTLIGIPIGLLISRGKEAFGFGMSLIFAFGYYILLIGGRYLALRGYLPIYLACWMPNLILGLVGQILIIRILRM